MKSFTHIQRTAWPLTALLLLMVSNVFAADPPNVVFILSDDTGVERLARCDRVIRGGDMHASH